MRKITLLAIAFLPFLGFGQLVTISNVHQIPSIGDTVLYHDANTFGFDAEGTGSVTEKIWDFAGLMDAGTEDIYFWWLDPAGLDGAGNFPTANIARGGTTENGYFFYNNTANEINRLGWYESASNYGIYHNSFATEFVFPFTASDNNAVNYSGEFSPFGMGEDSVTIEYGSISIQADMQGILILPTGEFHDVLRIHAVESFHITSYVVGTPATDNVIEDDYYYWFVDTILQPILIYGTTSMDGSQQSEVLRYQPIETQATGINNNTMSHNLKIFPNPSNGLVHIACDNIKKVEVVNVLGDVVISKNIETSMGSIDMSNYSKGVYIFKVYTNNDIIQKQVVVE